MRREPRTRHLRPLNLLLALLLAALVAAPALQAQAPAAAPAQQAAAPQPAPVVEANPLLAEWHTPFGVPPFGEITEEHFLPAFKAAIAENTKEIQAILSNPEPPTFSNTLEALDDAGELLGRVGAVFFNLQGAETNEKLQAIAREVAPMLAAHNDDISLNPDIFKRVKAVWEKRDTLELGGEQRRLLDETYSDFVRSGANLSDEQKESMRAVNSELATLGVRFSDNVLAETNGFKLVVDKQEDLAGLGESQIATAAAVAARAGLEGKWVFTLHSPSIWPFLQYSENRALRKQILDAYLSRCNHGDERDNNEVIARIAALRVEKAKLLGYPTWADFVLEKNMAKSSAGVYGLLDQLWPRALKVARQEAADMQTMIDADGGEFKLAPEDWRFYAEKIRKARYDLDDAELRPYFALDRVRDGAFYVANQLYGLTFTERTDIPVYNPEVRVFEVKEKDGTHVGLLFTDYHPRPGKRGGAWSSTFRRQWIKDGKMVTPVVANVCNFSRPSGDAPALVSLEEVETLFHEFGHALHQLLSHCRYRSLAGTSVPRDFVELPSQIMEHWAAHPDVLKVYAKHWKTGEPIPAKLIAKIEKSEHFNQGFATTEYLAASLLDMDWHTLKEPKAVDTHAFEKASLDRMGLIPEIPPRYHSTYFNHIVGGYAAGYYGYIWCEVLDSDAFEAFKEKGLFDQATAKSFRDNILSKGGSEEPMTLWLRFRGRAPKVDALLANRGLL